jgi:rSAM/selenodomain-associated transferase 1
MPTAIAVMARYPELGKVKTRLAQAIGAPRALALYRAFLRDLDERFAGGKRTLVWMYEPAGAPFAAMMPAGRTCVPQRGVGLSERMRGGFEELLPPGGEFDKVVMIGADVPHVRDEWIAEADERLADHDVVLGPSDDGGYYLIALRRPHDLFSMADMGTPRVFEQTLAAARRAGLAVHLLPRSFDVDLEADLLRLSRALSQPGSPTLAHTTAVLHAGGF